MAQLLSNLPNRALIKFGKHQVASETAQPIIWMVVDKNHSGYPANSVTLITQKIIDLRAYDAKEPNNTSNNNARSRGNTDYELSNINAWLNSSASAGNWYTPTHTYDAPPDDTNALYGTSYQSRPGFLYNFTELERFSILSTTLNVKNSKKVTTKVFLPSVVEAGGESTNDDGSVKFSGFSGTDSIGYLTSQAYGNTTSVNKPEKIGDYWEYLSRTNNGQSIYTVRSASTQIYEQPCAGTVGVRPVINLAANLKISDTVDSDGCYTVLPQSAPVISGSNTDLGTKGNYYTTTNGFPSTLGFTQTYKVTDADNDPVTVTEYIDNVKIRSYVATSGATNTFDVTGNTWMKLANGVHTMKITATDGFDEATRTYTFTKSVGLLAVQRATPIASSTKPAHIIVTVAKNIPDGAEMKVYVCNNGFDNAIVWEEIQPGEIYAFSNSSKTSGQWGVNVRVTVDRKGKEGACYITEIGGNFK